jgi:transcriptional regulator NrdR family protein
MHITIIKHHHHIEPYDEQKLIRSIYASCLAVRTPAGEAEITAKRVTGEVGIWIQKKLELTSHDIRIQASNSLHKYNPHAAYLYKNHGIVH